MLFHLHLQKSAKAAAEKSPLLQPLPRESQLNWDVCPFLACNCPGKPVPSAQPGVTPYRKVAESLRLGGGGTAQSPCKPTSLWPFWLRPPEGPPPWADLEEAAGPWPLLLAALPPAALPPMGAPAHSWGGGLDPHLPIQRTPAHQPVGEPPASPGSADPLWP